jgi:hypothetical protein
MLKDRPMGIHWNVVIHPFIDTIVVIHPFVDRSIVTREGCCTSLWYRRKSSVVVVPSLPRRIAESRLISACFFAR